MDISARRWISPLGGGYLRRPSHLISSFHAQTAARAPDVSGRRPGTTTGPTARHPGLRGGGPPTPVDRRRRRRARRPALSPPRHGLACLRHAMTGPGVCLRATGRRAWPAGRAAGSAPCPQRRRRKRPFTGAGPSTRHRLFDSSATAQCARAHALRGQPGRRVPGATAAAGPAGPPIPMLDSDCRV